MHELMRDVLMKYCCSACTNDQVTMAIRDHFTLILIVNVNSYLYFIH